MLFVEYQKPPTLKFLLFNYELLIVFLIKNTPKTFQNPETAILYFCRSINLNTMCKVLGIGNALVDLMTRLENDEQLNEFELPKGAMILVDEARAEHIHRETAKLQRTLTSGGSAANTIHGLAKLGIQTGYLGKVGNDELGQIFKEDLHKSGIKSTLMTGKALT